VTVVKQVFGLSVILVEIKVLSVSSDLPLPHSQCDGDSNHSSSLSATNWRACQFTAYRNSSRWSFSSNALQGVCQFCTSSNGILRTGNSKNSSLAMEGQFLQRNIKDLVMAQNQFSWYSPWQAEGEHEMMGTSQNPTGYSPIAIQQQCHLQCLNRRVCSCNHEWT
jgi:hypothetical protein